MTLKQRNYLKIRRLPPQIRRMSTNIIIIILLLNLILIILINIIILAIIILQDITNIIINNNNNIFSSSRMTLRTILTPLLLPIRRPQTTRINNMHHIHIITIIKVIHLHLLSRIHKILLPILPILKIRVTLRWKQLQIQIQIMTVLLHHHRKRLLHNRRMPRRRTTVVTTIIIQWDFLLKANDILPMLLQQCPRRNPVLHPDSSQIFLVHRSIVHYWRVFLQWSENILRQPQQPWKYMVTMVMHHHDWPTKN
mmetsp:Transcript_64586/g.72186  ORF Transcript_64586/g.72186 Transcript_64586/m.72186 type:complete len:253 (+) Transcript_64586:257-1015(+)